MHSLVWFRNDFRVTDNPALYQACSDSDRVSAVYIDCPHQWKIHGQSAVQREFIARNLEALGRELSALGISLNVFRCDSFADVPALLDNWVRELDVAALYANVDLGVNEYRRDRAVDARLNIPLHRFNGDCVVSHGSLRTGDGHMYRVFTPFSRAWIKHVIRDGYRLLPPPQTFEPLVTATGDTETSPHQQGSLETIWPASEAAAQRRLTEFCRQHLMDYGADRDFPDLDGTSGLSPYLAIGVLSPNQCLAAIEIELGQLPLSLGEAGFTWLNELIWREFYRHLLAAHPRLSMHCAFKPETDRIKWRHDEGLFQSWCQGKTGYPIVDAAMRCLNQTGWMHNRLRMITAGFLTKDLQIDWRLGEAYFMSRLIDGDFAANNGGWQWAAGTGADAAPYFRIFNPTTQSQRFDRHGHFIKRWVPELAEVPKQYIHTPHAWLSRQGLAQCYPAPVVDHALERRRAIEMFESIRRRNAS